MVSGLLSGPTPLMMVNVLHLSIIVLPSTPIRSHAVALAVNRVMERAIGLVVVMILTVIAVAVYVACRVGRAEDTILRAGALWASFHDHRDGG